MTEEREKKRLFNCTSLIRCTNVEEALITLEYTTIANKNCLHKVIQNKYI